MKYFAIISASFLFFTLSSIMAIFLWNIDHSLTWKLLLIFCSTFTGYLFIRSIQIYSKIQLTKGELRVTKVLSSRIYDLNELTSWTEETNLYRVSFRKLKLKFPDTQLILIDHSDRENIEQLYHHLRTHYNDKMVNH